MKLKLYVSILSYNIHGLENKCLFTEFFEYVKSHDVIVLLETHICNDKIANFEHYFNNYYLYWKPAIKNSRYGRASGGSMIGVHKELCKMGFKYEFLIKNNVEILKLYQNDTMVTILPKYARGENWDEEFNTIANFFMENDVMN